MLAAESQSSDDDRVFNLRLAFARYLPPEARLGMLERRRAQLLERLAQLRARLRGGREPADGYARSLMEHDQETAEHDLSWIERLIATERARGQSPDSPDSPASPDSPGSPDSPDRPHNSPGRLDRPDAPGRARTSSRLSPDGAAVHDRGRQPQHRGAPPRRIPGGQHCMSNKIRVAIAGVGNCASALVQGIEYYRDADPATPCPV